jgi:hypothetical protein
MVCDEMRRMLLELDALESLMNDGSCSQTERSEAAQKAQELATHIREHKEWHEGCEYSPARHNALRSES